MKIFCIGRNYVAHAKELGNDIPDKPLVFMKPATALLKNGKDFYYPKFSNNIHYEGELVVKIGKNGKHIEKKFARNYIASFALGLDMTARDIQLNLKQNGHPWEIAKAFDHAAVIGDWLDVSEWKYIDNGIQFEIIKNGLPVQYGDTNLMIFDIETLIVQLSTYFTLQQGDLIYTGTPAGVGSVKIGDQIEGNFILNGMKKKVLTCEIK